jgi:hypothetical protein
VDEGGSRAEDEPGDVIEGGVGRDGGAVHCGEAVAEDDGAAAVGGAVEDEVGDVDSVAGFLVEEDACAGTRFTGKRVLISRCEIVALTDTSHFGTRAIFQ